MVRKASLRSRRGAFYFLRRNIASLGLMVASGALLALGALFLMVSFVKLPDFENFNDRKVVESTKIYDRTGKILLYDVHEGIKRTMVPFEAISPHLKNATIAIEDANFYHHYGIEPKSIVRAIIANISGGGFKQGGSTITQQVVKNTLLTTDKSLVRKFKELLLSFKLERAFTKEEILALYLNEIPYGGNIYGVAEASRAFFGKEPRDVTLTEAAYIASLPQAPTYYSPYGNNRKNLDSRKNIVLKRMKELGFVNEENYMKAIEEKVEFLPREPRGIKAPHFVIWVRELLAEKYGERAVEENGYRVITTLDYDLQKKAEEIISAHTENMEQKFGAKNMALVAIDPKTGQVLSMIGSRDYFEKTNEGNFNVALARRQPGSTFKPFAYATAFMKGYTPETVLFDVRTNFTADCDWRGTPLDQKTKPEECYVPENYEGGYRGPISMRSSLAQSRNITSVKTLYLAGIKDTIKTARRMGISSLNDESRFGLSLVLGGGEVSLLDITGAYGVFADDGVKNKTTPFLRIEDKYGKIVEDFKELKEEVLPVEVARQITSILSDNKARAPTFGSNSALYFPGKDVAVKTGTTNDYRDVWAVGYTPKIVLGMWAGNNNNTPITKGNSAGFTVTLVWRAIMDDILRKTVPEKFIPPEEVDLTVLPAPLQGIWQGGEKYIIDTISRKLATEYTPKETKVIIVIPEVHTILHWVNKDDPRGNPPQNPQHDPQYTLWEQPIREWVSKQPLTEGDRSAIPTEYDTVHTPQTTPILSLNSLDPNTPRTKNDRITISVQNTGMYPLARVELYVNGALIEKRTQEPFMISFIPKNIDVIEGENEVTIVAYDSVFNKSSINRKLVVTE